MMFDKEQLDAHGVGNLPNILTLKNKSSTLIFLELEEELSAHITDVLTKFQFISV